MPQQSDASAQQTVLTAGTFIRLADSTGFRLLFAFPFPASPIAWLGPVSPQSS
ncbi:MAG: hypothetical protein ABIO94_07320 [Opitutaceae bacterium]